MSSRSGGLVVGRGPIKDFAFRTTDIDTKKDGKPKWRGNEGDIR